MGQGCQNFGTVECKADSIDFNWLNRGNYIKVGTWKSLKMSAYKNSPFIRQRNEISFYKSMNCTRVEEELN